LLDQAFPQTTHSNRYAPLLHQSFTEKTV